MRIIITLLICFLSMTGCSLPGDESEARPAYKGDQKSPNIMLIVADDLGFSDIGAYGGEISTPTLDALAAEGRTLVSFHAQATCSPTRAMMLTGVDNHLNGMGTMAEDRLPHHNSLPGYVGHLNQSVITVADVLRDANYYTTMVGKWHLGKGQGLDPVDRGFTSTYALIDGGANHFNGNGLNAANARSTYTENGQSVARPDGIYSSDLFTDKAIEHIDESRTQGKPFFSYVAYTAPHWPLQAPEEAIAKYADRYRQGWDALRKERLQRMKAMGLVPEGLSLPPMDDVPAWDSLSNEEQARESRKMAVYAAMVDNLDANIARIVQHLKSIGEYERTVFVFMSDNGPDPYDRSQRDLYQDWIGQGYDNQLGNIGRANSYVFSGPGWAQASSGPNRYYKFLPSEGGTRVPMIVRIPDMVKQGSTSKAFASVLDITPTLLALAGVDHPGASYKGRQINAPIGRSMLPYFLGKAESVYAPEEANAFELFGHASVFKGPWKAVRIRAPWGDNSWSLYNLDKDPGEQVDLSEGESERLASMISAFNKYKIKNTVIDEPAEATAYPNKPAYIK